MEADEEPPGRSAALRRCVLALTVLHDIELVPRDAGVVFDAPRPHLPQVTMTWADIADAVGDADPGSRLAVDRLLAHVRMLLLLAWRPDAAERLLRPLGLPAGHLLHPGPEWVAASVPGGVLHLGLGLVGAHEGRSVVTACPPSVLAATGHAREALWPGALDYLESTGAVAGGQLLDRADAVLRPVGDCDVVTLLGSARFRAVLCAGPQGPMRAVAAPMRTRGWIDLRRIDPAFALAAAAAVDPTERGFTRPLLVTPEEVVLARAGGSPQSALADPAPPSDPWTRPVRYR